MPCIIATY